MPGYMSPGPGRGFGGGFGPGMGYGGRGCRNWFRATGLPGWVRGGWGGAASGPAELSPDTERRVLEQEVQGLQFELERIKRRLSEISSAKPEEQ